jgi:hypothetical protein
MDQAIYRGPRRCPDEPLGSYPHRLVALNEIAASDLRRAIRDCAGSNSPERLACASGQPIGSLK